MGAWIETLVILYNKLCNHVAPLVGAWIETVKLLQNGEQKSVAPLVGAWIETFDATFLRKCP